MKGSLLPFISLIITELKLNSEITLVTNPLAFKKSKFVL